MPRFYRAMVHENEIPVVGSGKNMLGVRVPPDPNPDIHPDDSGNVQPGNGGMSVAPTWRDLPHFLVPKRLKELAPKARGRNELACFRFGEGSFAASDVTEWLVLRPDSSIHATVQPGNSMLLADYQNAIGDTREGWNKDET
ncbi:hypothetical protein NA78x_004476 [Anatilimnocola sp. NA78]|uniref:hypothetical protein n=1 Tax=Anatilimnocola sp. NA78 TaxID=3415683 RepID=UPI003CE4976C